MKVVLIIQARMGSSRLPGKSMMDLAGAPLVGRILERVKRCQQVKEIVLAIPDTLENEALGNLGSSYGITVYAGSENDRFSAEAGCVLKYLDFDPVWQAVSPLFAFTDRSFGAQMQGQKMIDFRARLDAC